MKSVFALSALLFAGAVFAQESSSVSSTADAVASPSDNASTISATSTSIANASPSATKSATGSSSSGTASAKPKGSSSAAPAAATGSSYKLPSGTSSSCKKFLEELNTNTEFASCTAPLLTATNAFSPSSDDSQSQSSLVSTLDKMCATPGCSDKFIRTQLTNFGQECKDELAGPNANRDVLEIYDFLYIMQPFREAMCTKDGGSYCALKAPSSDSAPTTSSNDKDAVVNAVTGFDSDADLVNAAIGEFYATGTKAPSRKRAEQYVLPDTQTYRDNGIMYLFTLGSLSATSLCTECTKSILSAYAGWESSVAYSPGLINSPMLGGQSDLWKQVKTKCGDAFMAAVQSAVGTDNQATNSGVSSQVGLTGSLAGIVAVAMGFFVAL